MHATYGLHTSHIAHELPSASAQLVSLQPTHTLQRRTHSLAAVEAQSTGMGDGCGSGDGSGNGEGHGQGVGAGVGVEQQATHSAKSAATVHGTEADARHVALSPCAADVPFR